MKILTNWLRTYLPALPVSDRELADDLTLRGIAVEGVHNLGPGNGHLFEMDITTNRVDAMNHYGIAREAATIYNLPLAPLETGLTALVNTPSARTEAKPERRDPRNSPSPEQDSGHAAKSFPIRIEAPDLCGRFTARILRDVTIAPSSGFTAEFFRLLGQKQISNAVDASNVTLLGMGHPTHAFDLDKIDGGIIIRLARKGEQLKLLDGTERTLEPDDLVIADHTRAISLAGVMGGYDTMITPETKNILVESAWFSPAAIRRSSRRHLLHTDASHRFERGADFNAAPIANHLVTQLILEHGGHAEGPLVDLIIPEAAARTANRPPINLFIESVQRHLGATLDDTPTHSALTPELVSQYLTALGCTLTAEPATSPGAPASALSPDLGQSGDTFSVTLPSWRLDLEREIDLIEEIARVYGYNRFANTLPTPRPVLAHPTHAPERAIRTRLLALGFSEAVSSTFSSALDSNLFAPAPLADPHPERSGEAAESNNPRSHSVALENPLSEEASNLRPSLVPGMLTMLAHNLNRDVPTVRLFEQGHIFEAELPNRVPHLRDSLTVAKVGDAPQEPNPGPEAIQAVREISSLALGLTTASPNSTPLHSAADAPIFELKGAIESLASLFTLPGGPEALTFTTGNAPAWLHPSRSATALLGTLPLAHFGELSPIEAARRKLRQPVFLAEIHLAELSDLPLRKVTARELSRFQAVERDFSFLLPDSVAWHTISSAIHALALPELQHLAPVEIFRSAPSSTKPTTIPAGHHSLLLRTTFQSQSRTLTEDELTSASDRIIEALTAIGGVHRG